MSRKGEFFFLILLGIVFIGTITIPYVWAYKSAGSEYKFGGFLLNPIDGNSYLAKMYQGWQGNWRFNLPYTSQPGDGGYLFLFYLALGQFARLSGGTLEFTLHFARLIGSVALVISIWYFYSRTLPTRRSQWLAFGLALFSSGLGWLASIFGLFTADFWVAEGYPFLAAYANPHFPMGMAILVWILTPNRESDQTRPRRLGYLSLLLQVGAALILGAILPFGVVVAAVVLAGLVLLELWKQIPSKWGGREVLVTIVQRSASGRKLILTLLGGMPVLIYEIWITNTDPILAAWNLQNITASPLIWDFFLSYSPAMLLAIPGSYFVWREKNSPAKTLLLWAVLGFLLLYFPWSLQRRFMLGYMIPIAGLAAVGLDHLIAKRKGIALVVTCLVLLLSLPTNLMVVLGGIQALQNKDSKIVLMKDEVAGLDWLSSNSKPDALIMASPETGLFIPAYTGRRVLYGHPFETINGSEMKAAVLEFFNGKYRYGTPSSNSNIDYIFYGPRERELGILEILPEYKNVFSSGVIQIFKVGHQQPPNAVLEE